MAVKKGKYKAAVVCTIIGWVLLAVFLGVLIYCLCNMHVFQEDNPIAYAFLLPFVFEACFIASFFLNKSYRKENKAAGIPTGKLCTSVYVITIIGLIPLIPVLIVYFVGSLILSGVDKVPDILPEGTSSSKIKVKDENGDEHTLTQSFGRDYKDEDGNWWTQDYFDSNKFTKN